MPNLSSRWIIEFSALNCAHKIQIEIEFVSRELSWDSNALLTCRSMHNSNVLWFSMDFPSSQPRRLQSPAAVEWQRKLETLSSPCMHEWCACRCSRRFDSSLSCPDTRDWWKIDSLCRCSADSSESYRHKLHGCSPHSNRFQRIPCSTAMLISAPDMWPSLKSTLSLARNSDRYGCCCSSSA